MSPALVLLALWVVWILNSGGYYPDLWYGGGLVCCSLLGLTMALHRRVLPPARAARLALLIAIALVAVNYASMLWAASPGSALYASDELLVYLLGGWTVALLPWKPATLCAFLLAFATAVALICALGLAEANAASNLVPFFDEYRYATPLNYPNGTAALGVMALWPLLVLSSRHECPLWTRPCALALAVFLAQFCLLPQSRGALVGLLVSAVVVLLVARPRLRVLIRMLIAGGAVAISLPATVAVNEALSGGRRVEPVLAHDSLLMVATSLAALLLGLLLMLAERRWGRPERHASRWRVSRRTWLALAAAASMLLIGGAVVAEPPLARFISRSERSDMTVSSARFTSLSPEERTDYARVALKLFQSHRLLGVGSGNFGRFYDALRRYPKHSQYTHDLTLRVLSETGLVGLAIFFALLVALAAGLARAGRSGALGRGCAVAVLGTIVYFLAHSSFDWLDEIPALAAPALAFPLAVAALDAPSAAMRNAGGSPLSQRLRPWTTRSLTAGSAVLLLGGSSLALGAPYLSTRLVQRALATYTRDTVGAERDLRRAETLNPFSVDPYVALGTIDENFEEAGPARVAFQDELRVERDWFPIFQLALLDLQAGRFDAARSELVQAARLDVDDPLLAQVRLLVQRRERVDPIRVNALLTQGPQKDYFGTQRIR